jgi:hypothetical protein
MFFQRNQVFLSLSCAAGASGSNWNEVRSSLVAEVLRRPNDSSTPRRLYGEVCGESMVPALWPGDVVAIEPCKAQELRVGEVVLAAWGSHLVLHRLMIPYSAQGFRLRGDCVAACDPTYPTEALLGKIVGVVDGNRTVSKLFLQPGIGAKAAQALGWILCHWGVARRIWLRLRRGMQLLRRKTDHAEFTTDFIVRGER